MTPAWITRLHPLTRMAAFVTVSLHAALCAQFVPQLMLLSGLLLFVAACGAVRSHWRLIFWIHLFGLPGTAAIFIAAGYERTNVWPEALTWGALEAARYTLRLESLFLANMVFISTISARELMTLLTHRWVPEAAGILFSTAVRFIPLTLKEARRIYDVQRCRGLRLRPWAPRSWLPILIPLFVSQMRRAHDTALMLVVRRIVPRPQSAPACCFCVLDWIGLGLSACLLVQPLLWFTPLGR